MTAPSQQSLFFDRPASTLARPTDPLSSHLAAAEVTRNGTRAAQADAVLTAVRKWPFRTSRELAAKMGADRYMVARRLPELRDAGLVLCGEPRVCAIGRRAAVEWWPVNAAVAR